MSKESRLNHITVSPQTVQALVAFAKAAAPGIEPRLRELINLRISQINGCAFCLDMHAAALARLGMPERKLHTLAGWREAQRFFDARERAALAWAEAVNAIPHRTPADEEFAAMQEHFSAGEVAEVTFLVAAIRAFNMLNVSLQRPVPETPYVVAE